MNSPNRTRHLISNETAHVILPDLNRSLEIERDVYRNILFYSCIYQVLVIISSLSICIRYGGTSNYRILFTTWIIACD